MRIHNTVILLIAVATATMTGCATAQVDRQEHNCRVALNKFNASPNSEAHRWAVRYGRLNLCGNAAVQPVADALRDLDRAVEADLIREFVFTPTALRHPAIQDAALQAAEGRAQSARSRVAALQVALAQYNAGIRFVEFEDLRLGARCQTVEAPHLGYALREPLPADYPSRLVAVATRVMADSSAPDEVRAAASCIPYLIRDVGVEAQP